MSSNRSPGDPEGPARAVVDFDRLEKALDPLSYRKRLELLHFLVRPHYLEEIASHLGMSRQAARSHVDKLLDLGVIEKRPGERASGPVVEYVLVQPRLFELTEEFAKLGTLRAQAGRDEDAVVRTRAVTTDPEGEEPGADGPTLVLVHGMDEGRMYALESGQSPWVIGRGTKATVQLDYDPFVSNQHARVERREGAYALVDTYSTNGTFLDWERIPEGGWAPLEAGSVVGVGKSLLVFRT